MSIIGSNILAGASGQGDAYLVERSLRFNDNDSANLTRTFSTNSSAKWTWSGWVKRCRLGANQALLSAGSYTIFGFNTLDNLRFERTSNATNLVTTVKFQDLSAWYHIVLAADSTQSTGSDKLKLYVNGSQITSFSPAVHGGPGTHINTNIAHSIGKYATSRYLDGYLAEVHFVDGEQLEASDFGEYDSDSVWQPKEYSGTHGNNGFYLDFSDNSSSAALGTDNSSNSNTWTVNNLQTSAGASFSTTVWTSGDSTWTIATGGGSATMSSGGYADVFSGLMQTGNVYAFTSSWTSGDTNGGWFFSASNADDLSGTHPNEGRGDDSIGQRGGLSTLGAHGEFATANGVGDGNANISGFGDTNPAGSDSLTWVVDRNNHKVWVSDDGGSSWVKGGNPFDTTSTASFSLPSTGNVYFGFIQNTQMTNALTIKAFNLSFNDSLVDSPTNGTQSDTGAGGEVSGNYATLNPRALGDNITLSNGNLEASEASTSGHTWAKSTIGVKSGKWYVEIVVDSATGPNAIGLTNNSSPHTGWIGADGSAVNGFNMIYNNASTRQIFDGNVVTTNYISGSQWTEGDVLQIAYDADNEKAWFGINNTWYQANGSSTTLSAVEAGTNATFVNFNYSSEYFFTTNHHDAAFTYNFGQRRYVFSAPSGFKALCTANLSDTTVTTSGSYTGNSDADGPFVYLNGVPEAMTIGGSAVTFGTGIDSLSNGFKITSASTNNTSGTSYSYSVTTAGDPFKTARAQTN